MTDHDIANTGTGTGKVLVRVVMFVDISGSSWL